MALDIITETSAAQQQLDAYNRASGMVRRSTYHPSAGTAWVVVGLVLADAAVPGDEATLVSAIEALAEVTTVSNPRVWGQLPAELLSNPGGGEPDTHEAVLIVVASLGATVGYGGDTNSLAMRQHESITPPAGKKWMVINAVLPAELQSAQDIDDLEMVLEGVTGVTTAEHLVGGIVPANASDVSLVIETRMRIDPVEVE